MFKITCFSLLALAGAFSGQTTGQTTTTPKKKVATTDLMGELGNYPFLPAGLLEPHGELLTLDLHDNGLESLWDGFKSDNGDFM